MISASPHDLHWFAFSYCMQSWWICHQNGISFGPVCISYEQSDISILPVVVLQSLLWANDTAWYQRHHSHQSSLNLIIEQTCTPDPANPLRPWPTSGTGDSQCACSCGAFWRCYAPKGMRKARAKGVLEISLEHTTRTMACKMGAMIDFLARRSPR